MAKPLLHVSDYHLSYKGREETIFEQIIGCSLQESYEAIMLTSHLCLQIQGKQQI